MIAEALLNLDVDVVYNTFNKEHGEMFRRPQASGRRFPQRWEPVGRRPHGAPRGVFSQDGRGDKDRARQDLVADARARTARSPKTSASR